VRVLASSHDSVIYIHQAQVHSGSKPSYVVDSAEKRTRLHLALPAGRYRLLWVNTKTGDIEKPTTRVLDGSEQVVESPVYSEDIALRVQAVN
jgi:hypothetical protein